jgi:non-lysosomal glucosylceramidase
LKNRTTRRDFVKTAVAAGIAATPIGEAQGQTKPVSGNAAEDKVHHAASGPEFRQQEITFPRRHTGRTLARVSCPLGGIGTGGIGLGGRGNLQDWQIFNRADIGNALEYSLPCMYVKAEGIPPYSVVLERRLLPPYDLHEEGLGAANAPGLPRLDEATFLGSFPTSRIEFADAHCPVHVALDAFSPFQPIDADGSGLPCAVLTYEVKNPGHVAADVVVAWALTNPVSPDSHKSGADGRTNEARTSGALSGLYMTNPSLATDDPMQGSFVLAALSSPGSKTEQLARWRGGSIWHVGPQHFWFEEFSKTGSLGAQVEPSAPVGCISLRQTVAPSATGRFRFLLTWYFPNRTPDRSGWEAPAGEGQVVIGNWYCTQFKDAWEVAEQVQQRLPVLETGTRAFVDTLQRSTLPDVVKEAASANLSTLVSNTSFRIADGSFQGFEGCGDHAGLGFGTCTHVWNYEVATQFLFPTLARSMRETSFSYAMSADGHMDFRHKLPPSSEHWGAAAADGQMGQIVKLYFDWMLCGDDEWLRKQWPEAKRALAYAWRPGGWDERKFGVMDGVQHNTYDVEFYGPNPMCSGWYLAALRASSLMANAMGDAELAADCRAMVERGSKWIDANLFNGEYYIQQIRAVPKDKVASGLQAGMGARDTLHPEFQVGDGCLVDQLLGQYMATLAGLGDLLDSAHIRKTLASIYKYNYKPDLRDHPSVQRVYALNSEAALILCDFTVGTRPQVPMPYYAENFTGSEYAAATLMLGNGMVKEGVECIASIRRRYDGERANPFDETEYGRHYARAMASWAPIPMLSGFRWDGRRQCLELAPKTEAKAFECFWSTPTAWGSVHFSGGGVKLEVSSGSVSVKELVIGPGFQSTGGRKLLVTSGGNAVACSAAGRGKATVVQFASPVIVAPDQPLEVHA